MSSQLNNLKELLSKIKGKDLLWVLILTSTDQSEFSNANNALQFPNHLQNIMAG